MRRSFETGDRVVMRGSTSDAPPTMVRGQIAAPGQTLYMGTSPSHALRARGKQAEALGRFVGVFTAVATVADAVSRRAGGSLHGTCELRAASAADRVG